MVLPAYEEFQKAHGWSCLFLFSYVLILVVAILCKKKLSEKVNINWENA